jgi:hypothetical protein
MVASYGATGNVAFEGGHVLETKRVLAEITGRKWAVLSMRRLDRALAILTGRPIPSHDSQIRPTPGLAFAVVPALKGIVRSTDRAVLKRISPDIVAVWKLDLLDGDRLHANRRGGWGGVSTDIAEQVGGRWTACSRRTLDGLRWRAVAPR